MSTGDENLTCRRIQFKEVTIETTITKDLNVVTGWITEIETSGYYLKNNELNIGLDTEWTPLGSKTEPENPIAILQLCVGLKCLIFQANLSTVIPGSLITFFNNPKYTFTGVEIKKDFEKLAFRRAFLERNMETFGSKIVDLRELAVEKGLFKDKEGVGMISLAKTVLKIVVEKDENVRMSIWHTDLTSEQVKYASIDAYLSFEIGKAMLKMEENEVENEVNVMDQ